ncbi:MAG TPA: EAL domain-containing protein [Acidimicrobiales bacterium]|nr:EAL domain-containing protein [Acidimicrobiales bacterium]
MPRAVRPREPGAGEDDFLSVVRATVDGILVVDERGRVRFANPAAASLLGRDERDLEELPFGVPVTGAGGFAQLDVARPDGTVVAVEMHVAPLRWRGGDAQIITLRDVSQRISAERRLARSEARFALSAKGANDGLWDWDRERGRVHTSARFQEMLGRSRRTRELTAEHLFALVHPDDRDGLRKSVDRHLNGRSSRFRHEFRLRRSDGSWVWVMARGIAVLERGAVLRFAGSLTDITDRKQAEDDLRRAALQDPLTGLANRSLLLDHLHTAIERGRRTGTTFAVLFVDLDRFKLVNDSLGHSVGDAVLVEVGRRLEACVRSTDTVARLGGDEFAVLVDEPQDFTAVLSTVERLREAVAAPISAAAHVVHITASVGVARSEDVPPDPETALRYADIAMYRAKRAGGDASEVFTPTMHAQASSRLRLQNDLRLGIGRGEVVPHYQPIVDLGSGRIVGFEALARWHPPHGPVLEADSFIDVAEEVGLIVPLGREVLASATRQLSRWRDAGFDVQVLINISQRQLDAADLAHQIGDLLADLDLDGTALGIEITERTATVQSPAAAEQIARLRDYGLRIVIDDFGTGYSSLSAIHALPLTTLKIDKAFVRGLESDGSAELITTIVAMARTLGLEVVAEGIETPSERDRLRRLGCDRGQGFLFGRPVDAAAATRLLEAQSTCARSRSIARDRP